MITFLDLLERHGAALRRLAWSYTRGASEGEDLFQEIAVALWTALPQFRGQSSERTWLYRVAHNTAISYVAGVRRRTRRETTTEKTPEPAATGSAESDAIQRQRQETVLTLVCELPMPDRQLVVLYLEGLSAAEIEAVTGLSQANVATRLTRIRRRLAAQLREREKR